MSIRLLRQLSETTDPATRAKIRAEIAPALAQLAHDFQIAAGAATGPDPEEGLRFALQAIEDGRPELRAALRRVAGPERVRALRLRLMPPPAVAAKIAGAVVASAAAFEAFASLTP